MAAPNANQNSPEEAENFVLRRMSLRHLRVLLALHETGSLSAAAQALFVTQPAISKRIAGLEQQLKVRLFDRLGRGFAERDTDPALYARQNGFAEATHWGADVLDAVQAAIDAMPK